MAAHNRCNIGTVIIIIIDHHPSRARARRPTTDVHHKSTTSQRTCRRPGASTVVAARITARAHAAAGPKKKGETKGTLKRSCVRPTPQNAQRCGTTYDTLRGGARPQQPRAPFAPARRGAGRDLRAAQRPGRRTLPCTTARLAELPCQTTVRAWLARLRTPCFSPLTFARGHATCSVRRTRRADGCCSDTRHKHPLQGARRPPARRTSRAGGQRNAGDGLHRGLARGACCAQHAAAARCNRSGMARQHGARDARTLRRLQARTARRLHVTRARTFRASAVVAQLGARCTRAFLR
jgi:hypothetical protein